MPRCAEILSTLDCVGGHLTEMATGQAPLFETTNYGNVGQPDFEIPKESLEGVMKMQFSIPGIAQLVGVSVRTVQNRMSQDGLSIRDVYIHLLTMTTLTKRSVLFSKISLILDINICQYNWNQLVWESPKAEFMRQWGDLTQLGVLGHSLGCKQFNGGSTA